MKRLILKSYHGLLFFLFILLYFISFPLSFVLYGKKNIWLISEINFDARDNGYHFFKYLRKEHPEINSIYVINKANPNYSKASCLGKTIKPHSYKHLLYFISAKIHIKTIAYGLTPNKYIDLLVKKHYFIRGKFINLKHGIYKDLSQNDFKCNSRLDMLIAGSYPEYIFIRDNYGYNDNEVVYAGLARFDDLFDYQEKQKIIIMPTWRRWLSGVSEFDFEQSELFVKWKELLSSDFIKKLANDGFEVAFYVHPVMNKYCHSFNKYPGYVTIHNSNTTNLQELMKESKLLITDFSSVFFDFAFMNKPLLYFQFDEKRFFAEHYTKSYFDYYRDGFGPVASNVDEAINYLKEIKLNNFINISEYRKRIEATFKLKDNRNCQRIYKAIVDNY